MVAVRRQHGGARPGAGRPKGSGKKRSEKKVMMSVRLSPDVVEFLRGNSNKVASQSDLIEAAVRKIYRLPDRLEGN